jgi:Reverse transcriptase (RNA-dependent DNA polymerase)
MGSSHQELWHQGGYKARIVARGFSMKPGEDYFNTHTSVVKSTTIQILLSLAAALGMIVELVDVETTYLNAALRESIHAEQPPYPELKDCTKYVLLLKQALYGLPQSGFQWAATLRTALEAIGFHSIGNDDNLYINNSSNSNSNNSINHERAAAIFIAVYVDDLVIASKDLSAIDTTIHNLNKTFNVRSLGPISRSLSLNIVRKGYHGEMHISQADYIRRILKRFHKMDCNSVKTPAIAGMKLHIREEGGPTANANLYGQMVGSIMHAAVYTRPDIAFVANKVSQYNADPSAAHMHAAKHLLRYLKGSIDLGITYSAGIEGIERIGHLTPITYADASYASDLDDSKSTMGYVIMFNGGAVSYRACKQGNVSLASAEAEYVAPCDAACDLVFADKILSQLAMPSTYPLILGMDTQSAICHVIKNTKHTQTKHFAVRFKFVKDLYIKGKVALEHIPSETQPADALTKAHGPTMHNRVIELLRMSRI